MRSVAPEFHPRDSTPPVSIVVEPAALHKHNQLYYRQFSTETAPPKVRDLPICYDNSVWQRQAVRSGRHFVKHVVPAVVKPTRILWNQFIGFVFMIFAVFFGFKTGRLLIEYSKHPPADAATPIVNLSIAAIPTLVAAWFAITSFVRARRISRS